MGPSIAPSNCIKVLKNLVASLLFRALLCKMNSSVMVVLMHILMKQKLALNDVNYVQMKVIVSAKKSSITFTFLLDNVTQKLQFWICVKTLDILRGKILIWMCRFTNGIWNYAEDLNSHFGIGNFTYLFLPQSLIFCDGGNQCCKYFQEIVMLGGGGICVGFLGLCGVDFYQLYRVIYEVVIYKHTSHGNKSKTRQQTDK